MTIKLRPYEPGDLEILANVWFKSWESTGVPSPVTEKDLVTRLPADIAGGWSIRIAEMNGEIVGFIAWHDDILSQLFVRPDMQNKGVGKYLLDFAKMQMTSGFHLTTASDSQAGRFYVREGLTRGETTTHRFGHKITVYHWRP